MNRIAAAIGFILITFASQAIWVTFSPVVTNLAKELNVAESYVGYLAVLYPLFFLVLTIPSGILLDRNFKTWLIFGALTTAIGGIGRILMPNSYTWLFICQLFAAIGQPFLLNAFVPFASRLFPNRRSLVISILSLFMYLGAVFSQAIGYFLYTNYGLYLLILPSAVLSLISLTILIPSMLNYREENRNAMFSLKFREVMNKKDLLILGFILGLGVAAFDNLATWLQPALATVNLGHIAGNAVAIAIIAGLLSISITPNLITRNNLRTIYIRSIIPLITIFFLFLAFYQTETLIYLLLAISGFLMLPAYPIIMDWIGKFHEKEIQGSATGFVGLVSRAISVSFMFITPAFIYSANAYFVLLTFIVAVAFLFSLLLPNDRKLT